MAKKKRNGTQDEINKQTSANNDNLLQAVAQGVCSNPNHSALTPAQIADLIVKITDELIDLF